MFAIAFHPHQHRARHSVAVGSITLGHFSESFEAPLAYWSVAEYEAQWLQAAERIVGGAKRSAFITSMLDPVRANFIVWWPMWRVGSRIHVRNHLMFMNRLRGDRNLRHPYRHVGQRTSTASAEDRVSEWHISVASLEQFLVNRRAA